MESSRAAPGRRTGAGAPRPTTNSDASRQTSTCQSGSQSRLAAQALLVLGYTNVWNLDKGMEAWLASGRAVVQESR